MQELKDTFPRHPPGALFTKIIHFYHSTSEDVAPEKRLFIVSIKLQ